MWKPRGVRWASSVLRSTAAFFASKARRQSFLILVAYVSAIAGVFLSLAAGNPSSTNGQLASAGLGLMGLSFVLLFLVSISITNFVPDRE